MTDERAEAEGRSGEGKTQVCCVVAVAIVVVEFVCLQSEATKNLPCCMEL
jgi:hypothetical protein